jgi:hypothetical protein
MYVTFHKIKNCNDLHTISINTEERSKNGTLQSNCNMNM